MKKIITSLFLLALVFGSCFAQVKSFDLTDVKDYQDIEDNLVLINKTSSKIYSVVIYGVKDKNCSGNFVLSDFCKKNEDGTYSFNNKAEKIATIRGLGAGKREKISMDELLLQCYRYYIVYVEDPSDFVFSISDIRESHEDMYITLEGAGVKKDVVVEKVYVEKTSENTSAPSVSITTPSSTITNKSSAFTLKQGTYTGSGANMKINLAIGIATFSVNYETIAMGSYKIQGNRLLITWNTVSSKDYSYLRNVTSVYTIEDEKCFTNTSGATFVYTGF